MIEETKYDDSIECHHSYDERCHTTYTTDYEPQQVSFVCEKISPHHLIWDYTFDYLWIKFDNLL